MHCRVRKTPPLDSILRFTDPNVVITFNPMGRASVVATGWMVRGSNPAGDEIFRTRTDRHWGSPSLLYKGYRVKRPGRGTDYPPPSSTEVKERVELYIYSPTGPSWPVPGRTFN